ncbi:MAG: hypothetical protein IIA81_04025 [Thaumarchaeota archaeon]|nr:hypothetical protein [Nitrososphaerota archaeon]
MAKHKKKKSPPTPDPDDSKKKPEPEPTDDQTPPTEKDIPPTEKDIPPTEKDIPPTEKDIPPTEKDIPPTEKDITPTEPVPGEYDKSRTKYMINVLFWFRVTLAIMGGIAATFIFDSIEGEVRRWTSIAFMIILFIVSIGIAKSMKMQLPRSDRKKLVTTGIGSFVFLYLFSWILSYTLVNVTGNESGVAIPFP